MKKILSRVGIGSANVDTVLPTTRLTAGESVEAQVEIEGGSVEQEVEEVYFALLTRYRAEEGHETAVVDRFSLAESFTIEPDEERSMPVTIDVPHTTPVTVGGTKVWIETGLDIEMAVDPDDTDHVEIEPTPRTSALFDAAESLGFTLKSAELEANRHGMFASERTFVQEFEFRPHSGPFAGALDELELVCLPSENELQVHAEVDRRGGLFSEITDTDERFESFTVRDADADAVEDQLRAVVEKHA